MTLEKAFGWLASHGVISVPIQLALAALVSSCAAPGETDTTPDCTDNRCDSASSFDELLSQLDGHSDPLADVLRAHATSDGTLVGDYNDVLDHLGAEVGCTKDTEKSFVVLSNAEFIPKNVFARCAESPQAASRFFVAAPSLNLEGDMDPQSLHITAWDEDNGRYRHYATTAGANGDMRINVQPSFCIGCHGGVGRSGSWQPLMNEMTNPWSGWNAEPGFESQLFDEFLDQEVAASPIYGEMLSPGRLDSASNLEPLVRAGIARYTGARLLERNLPAALDVALDLLRPLYCDETVNYVSEVHRSGELRLDALVDTGLLDTIEAVNAETDWSWKGNVSTRLPILDAGEEPVTLITTRATAATELERGLIARGVLSASEVLRIRALDWSNPVGSDLRCKLLGSGAERIRAGEAFDVTSYTDTSELIAAVHAEVLVAYPASADKFTVIRSAGEAAEFLTVAELGAQVETRLAGATRGELAAARDARGCWADASYLSAPIIPSLVCP